MVYPIDPHQRLQYCREILERHDADPDFLLRILVDNAPLAARLRGIIYQQDGAPVHFGIIVRNWLNTNYPDRWIGRGGPIELPARSPDLTPCDFYLWGCMKDLVYAVPTRTREQLRERIMQAGEWIRENLQHFRMRDAIRRRLEACIRQNGGHFEQLLTYKIIFI